MNARHGADARAFAAAAGLLPLLAVRDAFAHAGERAYVLLLPTPLFIAGGTLVVALSFIAVLGLPRRWAAQHGAPAPGEPAPGRRMPWATAVLLAVVVAAGYLGSRDPLANPLPTTVWSLWWVGVTFLHALGGNLWGYLNPLQAAAGLPRPVRLPYPERLAYWPAVAGFSAFAWFELVFPAPQDPALLAHAIVIYLGVSLAGMSVFGARDWLRFADPFAVFFRMVAWLAPLSVGRDAGGSARLRLGWPCAPLLRAGALPASGVAFVILVLAAVSFDGLSRTFWWLALLGENPLEYPGRTALVVANTLGLAGTFAVFSAAYALTVLAGAALSGQRAAQSFPVFVLSLIPIAFGYHFAHYLPAFLVDAQYALRALSDPFALGWNLLGTAHWHVTASFLGHHASVEIIWYLQTGAIVLAHVLAIGVAHLLALRHNADRATLITGQLPALALMIGYTLLGLWLLSTPLAA